MSDFDNEFQYKIGGDFEGLDRATQRTVDRLLAMDQAAKAAADQMALLIGAGRNFAQLQANQAAGAKAFVDALVRQTDAVRAQVQNFGKTEAALLRVTAAQLGVADTTKPIIDSYERLSAAQAAQAAAAQRAAAGAKAIANIRAAAQAQERSAYQAGQQAEAQARIEKERFIATLEREAQAVGKTRAQILQLKAAQLGVSGQANPLIAQIGAGDKAASGGGVGNLAAQLLGIGSAVGGVLLAVSTVKRLTQAMTEAQSQTDRLQLQFTAGFGGAAASKEIDYVRATANALGLAFQDTAESYGKFAASTRGTSLEGKATREIFEAVSQTAAALGLNMDETAGTFKAFRDISSKGRVQLEELSGQLGDRIPSALDKSARAMGVTTSRLLDMVKTGELAATEFLPKLARIMRDDVAQSTELASKRMDAFTNRLGNAFNKLNQEAAQLGIGDAIKSVLAGTTDEVNSISEALKRSRDEGGGFYNVVKELGPALLKLALPVGPRSVDGRLTAAREELAKLQAEFDKSPAPNGYLKLQIADAQALIGKLEQAKSAAGGIDLNNTDGARLARQETESRQQTEIKGLATTELDALLKDLRGETSAYAKAVETVNKAQKLGAVEGKAYYDALALVESKLNSKKTGGGGDVDKAAKRDARADIRLTQEALRSDLAANKFYGEQLAAEYELNLTTVEQFFSRRSELQDSANAKQIKALEDEIATLARLRAKAKDPNTREDASNRIEDAQERLRAAVAETARDEVRVNTERTRAWVQLSQAALGYEQQLQQLRGDDGAAAGARDIQRAQEFADFNRKIGGGAEREAEFTRLLNIQREVENAQRQIQQITELSALAEQSYLLVADERAASQIERERELYGMRKQQLELLGQELARVQVLAAASPGNTPLQIQAQKLAVQYKELAANVDEGLKRLRAFQEESANAFGQFAGSIVKNYRNAGDALKQLGDTLFNALNHEIIEKPIADFVKQQLRALTEGGGGLSGVFGQIFNVQGQQGAAGAAGVAGAAGQQAAALAQEAAASARIVTQTTALVASESTSTAAIVTAITAGFSAQVAAVSASTAAIVAAIAAAQVGGAAAGGIGSLIGGGLAGAGGAGFGGSDGIGFLFHSGGIAGASGAVTRNVPPEWFYNAPRYHRGGIAGDEVPAILRRGEEVLTESDPRHVNNAGSAAPINQVQQALHYHAAPGESKTTAAQNMRRFARLAGVEAQRSTAG